MPRSSPRAELWLNIVVEVNGGPFKFPFTLLTKKFVGNCFYVFAVLEHHVSIAIGELVNQDSVLRRRGEGVVASVLVEVGAQQYLIRIVDGRIERLEYGPFVMPSFTFSISAPEQDWQRFWLPTPPPGAHDLFALVKSGVMILKGDLQPFMANLTYFKGVMRAMRVCETR